MNNLHDFNKLKKAKIIVRDITLILRIVDLAITGLTPFKKYSSISETLACLYDNKTILDIHLNEHKRILANKGSVDNELED